MSATNLRLPRKKVTSVTGYCKNLVRTCFFFAGVEGNCGKYPVTMHRKRHPDTSDIQINQPLLWSTRCPRRPRRRPHGRGSLPCSGGATKKTGTLQMKCPHVIFVIFAARAELIGMSIFIRMHRGGTHTHTHNLMIMATLLSHRRRRRRRHADAQHISDKQKRAHPENITLLGRARARKNALTTLTNINDTRSSVLCVFVLIYVSQKRAQDCRRAKCQPTTPTSPHPNFISYANFNTKCFSKLPVVFYARMSDAQS